MGIAIAEEASRYGAEVDLVLGPVSIKPSVSSINVTNVTTASEMAEACISKFPGCEVAVLSAAVADYAPANINDSKIKKKSTGLTLTLEPTIDIAATLGRMKDKNQFIAGFALETSEGIIEATDKLRRKNMDIIVLNSLSDPGSGFAFDTNRIVIIDSDNNIDKFELKSKAEVAKDIIEKIISMRSKKLQ